MKRTFFFAAIAVTGITAWSQTTNCSGATQVCTDVSFSGNSSGAGTQELTAANQGCLGTEHQSSWYYFQPVTSGTVALTIQTSVDYDFAIWATGNCANLGTPVRCSFSANTGNTGLVSSYYGQTSSSGCGFLWLFPCYGTVNVSDNTESSTGDAWVRPLNVVAGQTYIMLIDNFTANSTSFTLDWTLTNGATLNCLPISLPLELLDFMAAYEEKSNSNKVSWKTASERYNDHFTLERSSDGENWSVIDQQPGAEMSDVPLDYSFEDFQFIPGAINYYRLSQTDEDGTVETFPVISTDNRLSEKKVVRVLNQMGQEVPFETTGIVILQYEDGTIRRIYRK
jgi:hypothetical protein